MRIAIALPDNVVTNEQLSRLYPEWSAEKILAKTGIGSRHVVSAGETAVDLAERAAKRLFAEYEIDSQSIDYILLCTQSPDYKLPSSACLLQDRLGMSKKTGALDFNLGCSGFVYGLSLAKGLVCTGIAKNVLLITAETYSKYIHPMDKSVRTIFGDGAAATLVDAEACEEIGAFRLGTDGSGAAKLIVRTGGAREAFDPNALIETDASSNQRTKNNVYMNGPEIFNFTLDVVPSTMADVLSASRLKKEEIDLFVFHQANAFMLNAIRKVNLIPRDKFYIDMEDTGNTVSSTIPIALARAVAKGVLKPGMRVMIMGFGVGLSWGATVLTWK